MARLLPAPVVALMLLALPALVRAQDEPMPIKPEPKQEEDKQKAEENEKELKRLDEQMMAAYQAKEFDKAISIGQQMMKLLPDPHPVEYNFACIYSLKGDKAASVEWLGKSAEHGFPNIRLVENDTDLASIRDEPGYKDAVKKIEANFVKGLEPAKYDPKYFVPPSIDPMAKVGLLVAIAADGQSMDAAIETYKSTAKANGMILVVPRANAQATGVGDRGAIHEAELLATTAIARASSTYNIDPSRVVLLGFSHGAFLVLNFGLRHPEKYCGVIALGARYDGRAIEVTRETPAKWPRFAILVGADDPLAAENRQAAADLETRKAPVQLTVYPNLGHAYPVNREEEMSKALEFVLKKD